MTPERQREVIAEWCGWKQGQCGWWEGPSNQETPHLPDYLNDLNEMHEAWCKLSPLKKHKFQVELWNVINRDHPYAKRNEWVRLDELSSNATAAQRAEALLRTIGKWED